MLHAEDDFLWAERSAGKVCGAELRAPAAFHASVNVQHIFPSQLFEAHQAQILAIFSQCAGGAGRFRAQENREWRKNQV